MIVRGEERAAADVINEVAHHRVRDGHAVEGRRAAAELVEDHLG